MIGSTILHENFRIRTLGVPLSSLARESLRPKTLETSSNGLSWRLDALGCGGKPTQHFFNYWPAPLKYGRSAQLPLYWIGSSPKEFNFCWANKLNFELGWTRNKPTCPIFQICSTFPYHRSQPTWKLHCPKSFWSSSPIRNQAVFKYVGSLIDDNSTRCLISKRNIHFFHSVYGSHRHVDVVRSWVTSRRNLDSTPNVIRRQLLSCSVSLASSLWWSLISGEMATASTHLDRRVSPSLATYCSCRGLRGSNLNSGKKNMVCVSNLTFLAWRYRFWLTFPRPACIFERGRTEHAHP